MTGYASADGRNCWKFPDGTLICSRKLQATVTGASWTGGLYRAVTTLGTFPVSFLEIPDITVTYTLASGTAMQGGVSDTSKTAAGNAIVITGSNASTTIELNYIAIGRWK